MQSDCSRVDRSADQWRQRGKSWIIGGCVEAGIADVADPGREPVAEQVHEGEEMVGESGRVGVVFLDRQVGLVIEQPVQNVGRVAVTNVDEFAVEGRVLVRDVRVDEPAGFGTVLRVHVPGGLRFAAGTEALPVRRRGGPISPLRGKGMTVLGVHQFRQRGAVGFVSDVGGLVAVQLGIRDAGAGFGHLRQSQIDPVGQDRGEKKLPVLRGLAGFEACEVAAESGPAIDLHEQVGDPDPREHGAGLVDQWLRVRGDDRLQRGDFHAFFGNQHPGKFIPGRQLVHFLQPLLKEGKPVLKVPGASVGRDQRQLPGVLHAGVVNTGKKVVIEVAELTRSGHPHVPGTRRFAGAWFCPPAVKYGSLDGPSRGESQVCPIR